MMFAKGFKNIKTSANKLVSKLKELVSNIVICKNKNKENALIKILSAGSEIVSNLGGVVVGGAIGGPAGAMIGASASPILNMLFQTASEDLLSRNISKRETQKIGAGYQFALKLIETNLNVNGN